MDNTYTVAYNRNKENGNDIRTGILLVSAGSGVEEICLDDFQKSKVRIGREEKKSDIIVRSPVVGRAHGEFCRKNGAWYYVDNHSTNGSYLLNRGHYGKIESSRMLGPLREGMIFLLGGRNKTSEADHESVMIIITNPDNQNQFQGVAIGDRNYTIGRDESCDLVIKRPAVSRFHALIFTQDGKHAIQDNRSRNGLFLNGVRVDGAAFLEEKDVIQIAGNILIYSCGMLFYRTATTGIQLTMCNLVKRVDRGQKVILSNVNCNIESNEFVAIVGGSGAGKSTLLKALGGYDQFYEGEVLYNGISLRKYYSILKNIIGYVPQEDIVYENLSLRKMLYYTAKLKMEDGTTEEEIDQRILEVLGLVELVDHQNTMIRNLSGGQKKRASIAVELLADPGMFFLDEPTSGLDPGTEQKLMRVLNQLAKSQGKTIVMVTHTTQSLDLCDRILFMGKGGRLSFIGTPAEAKEFFHTDSLIEIYNILEENTQDWADRFDQKNPPGPPPEVTTDQIKVPEKKSALGQLFYLTQRYSELTINDRMRIMLLFLQPLLIPILIKIVADKEVFEVYEKTKPILFTYSCSAIWIGIFNTIQEVCKERAILKREYMSNLRLTTYVLSKYLVHLVISLLQSVVFTGLFYLLMGSKLPSQGVIMPCILEMFLTTWLTIYSASALGLAVSSVMKNGDRAMAVSPFLLIIQLLFSGILFKLKGASKMISVFTTSRWSVEAMGSLVNIRSESTDVPLIMEAEKKMFEHSWAHLGFCWTMMLIFLLVFGLLCISFLRNVSKDR